MKSDKSKGSTPDQHKADALLDMILDASSRAIETCTDHYFYPYAATVYAKRSIGQASNVIKIPYFLSLDEVGDKYGNEIASSEYTIFKDNPEYPYEYVMLNSLTWPSNDYSSFKGQFGFTVAPKNVKLSTLLITAKLFNRPHTPSGIEGGALFIARTDPDVQRLLADYMDNIVASNRVMRMIA